MAQEEPENSPREVFNEVSFYSNRYSISSQRKSSKIEGASEILPIYVTTPIVLRDTIISFLSFAKHFNIPTLPVTLPDIRTVLGEGASFIVNGCELPKDYTNPATGESFSQGFVVALKRAKARRSMQNILSDRISVVYDELLTMMHPPLAAHPNIVNLLGISFEIEGLHGQERVLPTLVVECAELGNLADVLETARKEGRPLSFEQKLSLCIDVAHGLEILHACDIVHGDVKCENILVFESDSSRSDDGLRGMNLTAKLTDFGAIQLANGDYVLGGTVPWQAPEMARDISLKVDSAKKVDNFSFGMLVWRVFLDGDPSESLGQIKGTRQERREQRNTIITKMKKARTLVTHVCKSLALLVDATPQQIQMLCDVIRITLPTDANERELDISRTIRKLTYDAYYQERHPVTPTRMQSDIHVDLLHFDKWYSEFESLSTFVQKAIVTSLCEDVPELTNPAPSVVGVENKIGAAYQLAICYANGLNGKFEPEECLKWLSMAAGLGSSDAQCALKSFHKAFPTLGADLGSAVDDHLPEDDDDKSMATSSWVSGFSELHVDDGNEKIHRPAAKRAQDWLEPAQNGDYEAMKKLLQAKVKPSSSVDDVTPLHFLSCWDLQEAQILGQKLVDAGADIDTLAAVGPTRGGTPLMWSIFNDRIEHTRILLDLGANPLVATETGDDAFSLAARLHLVTHLHLLLEYVRPKDLHGQLQRLLEAAVGGDSRFQRIVRLGSHWQSAITETFELLKSWGKIFPSLSHSPNILLPALHAGAMSPFGRVNSDIQIDFVKTFQIRPEELQDLLSFSVASYNKELFEKLLQLKVPINGKFEKGRSLLHMCARIPDDRIAAGEFAPQLVARNIDIEQEDDTGLTPWMDAVLERKWDLADYLLAQHANPLKVNNEGYNALGLCIKTLNLGALKFLLKYTGEKGFGEQFKFANDKNQITPLQLAASLPLPRAHGMKVEVMGTFLTVLKYFAPDAATINYRSSGIAEDATAIEIAGSRGIVHAVWNLAKKDDVVLPTSERLISLSKAQGLEFSDFSSRINFERCLFIVENWKKDPVKTNELAADWTNLKTIDESKVASSWEHVVYDKSYRSRYVEERYSYS